MRLPRMNKCRELSLPCRAIMDECALLMNSGTETTIVGRMNANFLLYIYLRANQRLFENIETAALHEDHSYDVVSRLKYIWACIGESLRPAGDCLILVTSLWK